MEERSYEHPSGTEAPEGGIVRVRQSEIPPRSSHHGTVLTPQRCLSVWSCLQN